LITTREIGRTLCGVAIATFSQGRLAEARRNVFTEGEQLNDLLGTRFRIGNVISCIAL